MRTYIVEVASTHAQLIRASSQKQAERIAVATSRGEDRKVVKVTDVTRAVRPQS